MTQFMEFLVEMVGPWFMNFLWQTCTNFWGPPVIETPLGGPPIIRLVELVGPWVELVGPWMP